MLRKVPWEKTNGTNYALFCLSRALTYMTLSTGFASIKPCAGFSSFYSALFLRKFIFFLSKIIEFFDL